MLFGEEDPILFLFFDLKHHGGLWRQVAPDYGLGLQIDVRAGEVHPVREGSARFAPFTDMIDKFGLTHIVLNFPKFDLLGAKCHINSAVIGVVAPRPDIGLNFFTEKL